MNFGGKLPGERDLKLILNSVDGISVGKYYKYE
jgi:hypothetical protein